eukprot:TRINITY_DN1736_c0_g1_i1.p1 TRINITY_DN1736_c0_g1~~TRINITY_DN1736_c0_g1_i1.p1  ORF type:complete len:296 (-),score=-15.70 TRINITY_DN1736_c0_g1_i1:325-1212(-)
MPSNSRRCSSLSALEDVPENADDIICMPPSSNIPGKLEEWKAKRNSPLLCRRRAKSLSLHTPEPASGSAYGMECSNGQGLRTIEIGQRGSLRHRAFCVDSMERVLSPWHHIRLYEVDGLVNIVCKTPKGSWLKHQVSPFEDLTPIKVVKSRGKPSHYRGNSPFNMCLLPQTSGMQCFLTPGDDWEDCETRTIIFCPLEVIDVGGCPRAIGEVYAAKVLGAIEYEGQSGENHTSILVVAKDDDTGATFNCITYLQRECPQKIDAVLSWLQCDGQLFALISTLLSFRLVFHSLMVWF